MKLVTTALEWAKVTGRGQQIGNYRLLQILGQGTFGSVYLGEHLHLQTYAAIKLLHEHVEASSKDVFLQEARMIAGLKHPHILQVLEFGFDEQGIPYLVTEYAPKGTLRQHYARGSRVHILEALKYIKQTAEGLQYAHNGEVIHRDIKPENLLLAKDGRIVISDFGIALKGSRKFPEKDIAGTATYMAPEQFQGKPRRASDQYSLGIIAYEWLTGKPPFQGDFFGLAGQHVSSPVPSMDGVASDVAQVVLKALSKSPEQRFTTVADFAYTLEQAVKRALMTSTLYPPRPPLLPLICKGHESWIRAVAWSPDGSKIVSGSCDNTVQVWEVAAGKCLQTYKGHTDWVSAVAWSPDGSRIASGGKNKTVHIWKY